MPQEEISRNKPLGRVVVNNLRNPHLGRRTGKDVVGDKIIRKDHQGRECFADYFSDEENESVQDSVVSDASQSFVGNAVCKRRPSRYVTLSRIVVPDDSVSDPKHMSPFSTNSSLAENVSRTSPSKSHRLSSPVLSESNRKRRTAIEASVRESKSPRMVKPVAKYGYVLSSPVKSPYTHEVNGSNASASDSPSPDVSNDVQAEVTKSDKSVQNGSSLKKSGLSSAVTVHDSPCEPEIIDADAPLNATNSTSTGRHKSAGSAKKRKSTQFYEEDSGDETESPVGPIKLVRRDSPVLPSKPKSVTPKLAKPASANSKKGNRAKSPKLISSFHVSPSSQTFCKSPGPPGRGESLGQTNYSNPPQSPSQANSRISTSHGKSAHLSSTPKLSQRATSSQQSRFSSRSKSANPSSHSKSNGLPSGLKSNHSPSHLKASRTPYSNQAKNASTVVATRASGGRCLDGARNTSFTPNKLHLEGTRNGSITFNKTVSPEKRIKTRSIKCQLSVLFMEKEVADNVLAAASERDKREAANSSNLVEFDSSSEDNFKMEELPKKYVFNLKKFESKVDNHPKAANRGNKTMYVETSGLELKKSKSLKNRTLAKMSTSKVVYKERTDSVKTKASTVTSNGAANSPTSSVEPLRKLQELNPNNAKKPAKGNQLNKKLGSEMAANRTIMANTLRPSYSGLLPGAVMENDDIEQQDILVAAGLQTTVSFNCSNDDLDAMDQQNVNCSEIKRMDNNKTFDKGKPVGESDSVAFAGEIDGGESSDSVSYEATVHAGNQTPDSSGRTRQLRDNSTEEAILRDKPVFDNSVKNKAERGKRKLLEESATKTNNKTKTTESEEDERESSNTDIPDSFNTEPSNLSESNNTEVRGKEVPKPGSSKSKTSAEFTSNSLKKSRAPRNERRKIAENNRSHSLRSVAKNENASWVEKDSSASTSASDLAENSIVQVGRPPVSHASEASTSVNSSNIDNRRDIRPVLKVNAAPGNKKATDKIVKRKNLRRSLQKPAVETDDDVNTEHGEGSSSSASEWLEGKHQNSVSKRQLRRQVSNPTRLTTSTDSSSGPIAKGTKPDKRNSKTTKTAEKKGKKSAKVDPRKECNENQNVGKLKDRKHRVEYVEDDVLSDEDGVDLSAANSVISCDYRTTNVNGRKQVKEAEPSSMIYSAKKTLMRDEGKKQRRRKRNISTEEVNNENDSPQRASETFSTRETTSDSSRSALGQTPTPVRGGGDDGDSKRHQQETILDATDVDSGQPKAKKKNVTVLSNNSDLNRQFEYKTEKRDRKVDQKPGYGTKKQVSNSVHQKRGQGPTNDGQSPNASGYVDHSGAYSGKKKLVKRTPGRRLSNKRNSVVLKSLLKSVKKRDLTRKCKIYIPQNEENSGVRRSNRQRAPPMEYWRNERLKYKRQSTGFVIDGIIEPCISDTTSEIEVTRKKPKKPKQSLNKLKRVIEPPEDMTEVAAQPIPVFNPEIGDEVYVQCFGLQDTKAYYDGGEGKNENASPNILLCKTLQQQAFHAGEIILRPEAYKPMQNTVLDTLVFKVDAGQLVVRIHQTSCQVATGDFFFVPSGNLYSLTNNGRKSAKLTFFQLRGEEL